MPLLKARCVKCHGPAKREGKLNLASPRGIARGGKDGAVVVPGKPDESLLTERVEAGEMPPKEPLSASEQTLLRRWVASGAPGLPIVRPEDPEAADHWAFAQAVRPRPPDVRDDRRLRTPVDRFVQHALEGIGLSLGPDADRGTLIRRVSFDLTGLPPSPAEIEQFLDDPAPDAYERMLDRYLASPHYGERLGKAWLDAAGYADSNGYFNADSDRPLAHRYRDYVIRSWNEAKPLDVFIREQLAGDELARFQPGGRVTPAIIEQLVATHFLRNAPDGSGESDGNSDEVRADRYAVLEGTTQIVGSALLGVTIQCARCHDHKFEPISQADYYRFYAILRPAFDLERWVKPQERVIEAPLPEERARWENRARLLDAEINDATINHVFADPFVDAKGDRRKVLGELIARLNARRGERPGRIAWVADLGDSPSDQHLLRRGLYGDPGSKVEPAPPAILSDPSNRFVPNGSCDAARSTGRRLAFAQWLTRPGSRAAALLARVTANRLWQHHFGTGIVATPENLGYTGAPPTHPELLEWLACELAESGWQTKPWQRLIMTSTAYRQSSAPNESAAQVDPDNRRLWRYPVRRLDAEMIRDAMLVAAGEIDQRMGGPYIPIKLTGDGEIVVANNTDGARRRSIYLQQRRTQVPSVLEVFDAPSIVTNCTRRSSSTMALQSLSLLNSEFVTERARGLAVRSRQQGGCDVVRRLNALFLDATGRAPDHREQAAACAFLKSQPAAHTPHPDAEERAWVDLCHMVLASNAFLYVE
jgi:hypothetical protein